MSVQLGSNQPIFGIGFEPKVIDLLKRPYWVEELAGHLVLAVRETQPRGPYYLGGFCQDAIFAFEVARQLTAAGENIGLLALFEPLNPSNSARAIIKTALRRMKFRVGFRFDELRRLGIYELPLFAQSRWKGLKMMLTDTLWRNSARLQILNRQSNSHDLKQTLFLAASSYEPKPLGCPAVIFRCKDWPMLSAGDPYFGWRESLAGRTEIHEVPGDHVGMFRDPNVQALAEKLRVSLEKARKQEGHIEKVNPD